MDHQRGVAGGLAGFYRDVIRNRTGLTVFDSGWRSNAILDDCRRLLAGFMKSQPNTTGITGLLVGAGDPGWDMNPPGPRTSLFDGHAYFVPMASIQMSYLLGANVTASPTNRLQIVATLAPGAPPWPDANHVDATLREFGLVGHLDGGDVLVDYVSHPAVPKDPVSTLERTIWLVF